MIIKLLLFIIMIPGICCGQTFFKFGKDTTIIIKPNVALVRHIEQNINAYKSYDGQKIINIPIAIDMKKNVNYLVNGNFITSYDYDRKTDKVESGNNRVLMCTVNFATKKITKSYKNNNKDDHYKPKDFDDKVKKKEKEKNPTGTTPGTKPMIIGEPIIIKGE